MSSPRFALALPIERRGSQQFARCPKLQQDVPLDEHTACEFFLGLTIEKRDGRWERFCRCGYPYTLRFEPDHGDCLWKADLRDSL